MIIVKLKGLNNFKDEKLILTNDLNNCSLGNDIFVSRSDVEYENIFKEIHNYIKENDYNYAIRKIIFKKDNYRILEINDD
jgi:hypothetical protein